MSASFCTDRGTTVSIDMTGARQTVHDYLFGAQASRLTREDRVDVYLLCDGFGDTRTGEAREQMLAYMEGGWDWSHVRDSSPEALYRALAEIISRQRAPEFARTAA